MWVIEDVTLLRAKVVFSNPIFIATAIAVPLKYQINLRLLLVCIYWCVNTTAVPSGDIERWKNFLEYYTHVIWDATTALNVKPTTLSGRTQITVP